MVVDDELLAEERVTFRPPAESHGSGRARPAGPSPWLPAAAQTSQPRLRQPAGPPPPAASRPARNNFGPRPLPPPAPPRPAARSRPGPQPPPRPRRLSGRRSLGPAPGRLTLTPPGPRGRLRCGLPGAAGATLLTRARRPPRAGPHVRGGARPTARAPPDRKWARTRSARPLLLRGKGRSPGRICWGARGGPRAARGRGSQAPRAGRRACTDDE